MHDDARFFTIIEHIVKFRRGNNYGALVCVLISKQFFNVVTQDMLKCH
jgi:hypothetical protein